MSLRHAGARFPARFPPAESMVERTLSGVGWVLRSAGAALDEFGIMMQGSAAVKEHANPNLAWAPTKADPSVPPKAGTLVAVPTLRRLNAIKEIVMPVKAEGVFIAPSANVMGDVRIGVGSSVWYGAVLRGDVNHISVGSNTNIQDNTVVHVAKHSIDGKPAPTVIGDNVTIGHCATIHACTIGDNVLIGMGASVLDGCKIGSGSIVAAGAVVPPGKVVPPGQVWAGSPAKFLRNLEADEKDFISASASNYSKLADVHRFENGKTFEELVVESRIEVDRHYASDPINTIHQMYELDAQTLLVSKAKK